MAEIKTTKYTCDISNCKNEATKNRRIVAQIIMKTDETEGRSCDPYLSLYTIDLCDDCMETYLNGIGIFGWGAMGHNTYEFA